LHDHGVIHRDIKPGHIMVTADGGQAVLMDLGLAQLADDAEGRLTRTRQFVGTLRYASPQQVLAVGNLDRRTDVYSLGATLWELLALRPLFGATEQTPTPVLMEQIQHEDPPGLRKYHPGLPRDLEAIAARCLEKRPERRYATAGELADDLGRFLTGEPVRARPVRGWERAVKWARRRPAVAGLLASLVVVILLGFGLVLGQWHRAEDRAEDALREKTKAEKALRREQAARAGRALAQVQALIEANPQAVPNLLRELQAARRDVLPRLRRLWRQKGLAKRQRLRVGLALLPVDAAAVKGRLLAGMLDTRDPHEMRLLREALRPYREEFRAGLWRTAGDAKASAGRRFRALVALAAFDPKGQGWRQAAPRAVKQLLAADPLHLGPWTEALRPVRSRLLRPLAKVFRGAKQADRRLAAAVVLADYAAKLPGELVRLALDAEARQFALLLPGLRRLRGRALLLFRAELTRKPAPDWKDGPLPARPKPKRSLVKRLEAAHGLLAERFALCQDLPLGQFRAVADELERSGYRPLRLRPYNMGPKVLVATVWQRDGRDGRLALGVSAKDLRGQDEKYRKQGFVPLDVAGYGPKGQHHAAVWVKAGRGEEARFYAGVPAAQHAAAWQPLRKKGYGLQTYLTSYGPDGKQYYSAVWGKNARSPATWRAFTFGEVTAEGGLISSDLLMDLNLVPVRGLWQRVQPLVQAWYYGMPGGGWASLPWYVLHLQGRQSWPAHPERSYAGVWHRSATREFRESHGLDLAKHLRWCRRMAGRGYRPAALSVAAWAEGQPAVAASVWQRPVVPEGAKDALARRQANAAVALVRLGQAAAVWPLLRHRPDPRLRTYLIHRLVPRGVPPRLLIERLREERKVNARRALLLSLGEYGLDKLPAGARQALVPELLKVYRDDPDAGVHGAVDWLLRRWNQGAALAGLDRKLAGPRVRGRRRWYVNGQGQTLTVIQGPVEFLMGSPGSEPDRYSDEVWHRRRIGRSFALGTKAVTVAQFEQFRKAHPDVRHFYTKRFSPEPDGPIISVTWYEAAMYCQWLSEREGVPQEQWCYPSVAAMKALVKAGKPIPLPADYLRRTGYRLPTEAEWEYGCRAGARTSRYYGSDEELLGRYAWSMGNSPTRTRPVGLLKPNDWGLFDVHGNVWQWCQDRYVAYPEGKVSEDKEDINSIISGNQSRVLRGGAFFDLALNVRSAQRFTNAPALRNYHLRPARGEDLPLSIITILQYINATICSCDFIVP
jgi:formylglycine-generating enzyme required for sulfatase activity